MTFDKEFDIFPLRFQMRCLEFYIPKKEVAVSFLLLAGSGLVLVILGLTIGIGCVLNATLKSRSEVDFPLAMIGMIAGPVLVFLGMVAMWVAALLLLTG